MQLEGHKWNKKNGKNLYTDYIILKVRIKKNSDENNSNLLCKKMAKPVNIFNGETKTLTRNMQQNVNHTE